MNDRTGWRSIDCDSRRAVSTVVDVSIALLLVSVAVAILVSFTPPAASPDDTPESTTVGSTLTSTTVDANYTIDDLVESAVADPGEYDENDRQRIAHGTIGAHLATIAIANLELEGSHLSFGSADYEAQLDETIRAILAESNTRGNVTAVWEPIPGGQIRGTTSLGEAVPPHTDVSVTTMTVPSGIDAVSGESNTGVVSFDGLAQRLAANIVEAYLPERNAQRALESSGLDRELTVHRYGTFADVLGIDANALDTHLTATTANATQANHYLEEALASLLQPHLENQFETPQAAVDGVALDDVRITVRTWDA